MPFTPSASNRRQLKTVMTKAEEPLPRTMKGVQLVGHGGPEMLVWNDEIPTPRPGEGEILVKVTAAGVNNTDINTRIGWYAKEVKEATEQAGTDQDVTAGGWSGALPFPLIQGADLCGIVVALGAGVDGLPVGARVTCPTNQPNPTTESPTRFFAIGSEFDGAFAQYCVISSGQAHDVSQSPLTDVEVAAIPCAHGTAFNLLSRSGVTADDRVLVTGASGGVGLAAVELAKLRGAHVTALATTHKQGAVRRAGADVVFDRTAELAPHSFTAVIDVVGGTRWPGVIESIRAGGRYAVSGAIAGPMVEADLRTLYLNDLTLYGCSYTPHAVFAELIQLVNDGRVTPLVSQTYPLSAIHRAQEDFSAKKYPGKLVLIPPD
jgi:NADPH:quinone reductase-like Zn-dependent oxidoreductase